MVVNKNLELCFVLNGCLGGGGTRGETEPDLGATREIKEQEDAGTPQSVGGNHEDADYQLLQLDVVLWKCAGGAPPSLGNSINQRPGP